jgi:hypothetical protein
MRIDLLRSLRELGFEPVQLFSYAGRFGNIPIGTSVTGTITIGSRDFCVTELWLLIKGVGGSEGSDFLLKNETQGWEYSNRISPIDTGTNDRPKIPYQTEPGQPSMIELPWIINAGDTLSCYGFARFGAVNYFDVVLHGYKLNTTGAHVPYWPRWYHFNGHLTDLAATTFGVEQQITVSGPSDFVCLSACSNWDTGAANVDVRESLVNRSEGNSYSRKVMLEARPLLKPYNTRQEAAYGIPFKIRNNSTLIRTVSNYGTANQRRPELTLFGYFDTREGIG